MPRRRCSCCRSRCAGLPETWRKPRHRCTRPRCLVIGRTVKRERGSSKRHFANVTTQPGDGAARVHRNRKGGHHWVRRFRTSKRSKFHGVKCEGFALQVHCDTGWAGSSPPGNSALQPFERARRRRQVPATSRALCAWFSAFKASSRVE